MSNVRLTAPQAEMLRQVYADPGEQFPAYDRPSARAALAGLGLLENRDRNDWQVTQAGLDWLEANP